MDKLLQESRTKHGGLCTSLKYVRVNLNCLMRNMDIYSRVKQPRGSAAGDNDDLGGGSSAY
jgi:hypothetical protein